MLILKRQVVILVAVLLVLAAVGTVVVVHASRTRGEASALRQHTTYKPDPVDAGKRY